jgi:hypothetical protein
MVDKKPLLKNFRLNLPGNNQLRLKFDYIDEGGSSNPVDLVVYNYSEVGLKGARLRITFKGEERLNSTPFKLSLSFEFLKRRWRLSGTIAQQEVDEEHPTFMELFVSIPKYLVTQAKSK